MFLAVLVVAFASLFLPETTAQNAAIKKTPETKGEKVVKETVDEINGWEYFKTITAFSVV